MDTEATEREAPDYAEGKSLFERFGPKLFLGLVFLLPLFILPISGIPFEMAKSVLVFSLVFIAFGLFLLSVIIRGEIALPWTPILASLVGLVGAYLLSALASTEPLQALIGKGFEVDTVLFVAAMLITAFLVPLLFRSRHAIFNMEAALFSSFLLLALFMLARLAFPDALSFGIFTTPVDNLLGSWNDLGVLSGLIAILSLVALELLPARGFIFLLLHSSLFLSLLLLAIVNFPTLWYLVGGFALIMSVYSLSFSRLVHRVPSAVSAKRTSLIPLGVVFISLLFIFWGGPVGSFISSVFDINHITARPSWQSTLDIAKESLKENPLLGVGPNHFVEQWLLHKPTAVNETLFWNIDFNFGIGLIPSALATVGILGALAWLSFVFFTVFGAFRGVERLKDDNVGSYVLLTAAAGTLFLLAVNVVYTPGAALYALFFIFVGLFIASLLTEGVIEERVFSFGLNPSRNFLSVLGAIVLILGTMTTGYLVLERLVAYAYAGSALKAYGDGDIPRAELRLRQAIRMSGQDVHYRSLAQVLLAELGRIAADTTTSADTLRGRFQTVLTQTVDAGRGAVTAAPGNYQNWLSLGQVYEAVVPLKIEGAYENGKAAYKEAERRNPKSPAIQLLLARLEYTKGNNAEAKNYIREALTRKNNYTDAIFLLSQIEVAEGSLKKAIQSVEAAAVIDPNNPVVFFQLGLLRYNDKDYKGAVSALERAVALQPSYANARYFLGLSYDKTSRRSDAIAQFEELLKTNQGNEELKLILTNLKAGRSPFSDAKPPVTTKPESRKTLPVSE